MIYNHGKHEIELWDSIHNLPVLRFQRFNKYQMQSIEIGNTFEDYDRRTVKALQFTRKGMTDEAIQELENRRQTVYNALNEFSPVGRCLAILVKRIDSRDYSQGFAPDDLDRVLEHLERIGLGMDVTIDKLAEIKKKIETELVVYFPTFFPKNGNRQQTALRIRRMKMMLDGIIEPEQTNDDHLFSVEKEILETDRPNKWNVWVDGNMERVLEVEFRKFGIAVMEHSSESIEQISTFTFYSTVEHLKEKFKK
jgi:hypothetical protein